MEETVTETSREFPWATVEALIARMCEHADCLPPPLEGEPEDGEMEQWGYAVRAFEVLQHSNVSPWTEAETLHALAVRSADRRDDNPEFASEHAALALAINDYELARDSARP